MKSEYVLIHAAPIKHYGIKGQKKGVRRFQLDNGELTAAGKARYGVGMSNPATDGTHKGGYFTGNTGKTMKKMKDYLLRNTNYRMDDASTAAGLGGRALVGAYGKNVGKTRSSAPSVPAVDSKTPWGKRASAVASTPTTTPSKKETKDNLGQNGGRPYSTPYTQETAKGRKKNVTGSTTGASKNDKLTLEEKAPASTVGAKTQGAILKAHNAVRVTTQNKSGNSSGNKQLASPAKVDKDKLSSRGNEKVRDNVIKVGADLADIASDRAKQIDVITKTQNLLETASKASKQMDNGAVDTLKKKDLVKIKSGKNTRR